MQNRIGKPAGCLNLAGIILFICMFALESQAGEMPEFYRGIRAMGMGNAFTAVSDDYDAIFYNPAGLSYRKSVEFHLVNPKIEAGKDDLVFRSVTGGLDTGTMNKLFGKNFSASGNVFPSIYLPNFVIGYYYGADMFMNARNLSYPSIEARYNLDRGIITGFGFETRGFSKLHYARWGVGLKYLTRSGFNGTIPLAQLASADKTYLKNLRSGDGTGYGVSFGLQYEFTLTKMSNIILGGAWQDIGDIRFGGRLSGGLPPPQANNLAAGAAYVYRFGSNMRTKNNIKLSGEARHLLQKNRDPRLKMHFGTELQIGSWGVQAGVNQTSLCAGVNLDFWVIQLGLATYGVNTQTLAGQSIDRRYALQLRYAFDIISRTGKTMKEDDRYKYPRKFDR